jgi:hypothetical protein
MELFIFARFHARAGHASEVADAIQNVIVPTRKEPGCLSIHAFRSTRDARLFYIHRAERMRARSERTRAYRMPSRSWSACRH